MTEYQFLQKGTMWVSSPTLWHKEQVYFRTYPVGEAISFPQKYQLKIDYYKKRADNIRPYAPAHLQKTGGEYALLGHRSAPDVKTARCMVKSVVFLLQTA